MGCLPPGIWMATMTLKAEMRYYCSWSRGLGGMT